MNYRQGDLFFRPVKKMEGKEVQHKGSFVLAEGETTGHKHVITAERMEIRQAENGRYFLSFEGEAKITHEEHRTITMEPGTYEVTREREHDWFSLTSRKVID